MFVTLLSLFFACESKFEGLTCTTDIRSSAILTLVDQNGVPISDADISYSVDGTEGQFLETWPDGQYVIGEEEAGAFVVEIFAEVATEDPCCWEIGSLSLEFTIEENECHVETQTFEPELEWDLVCADVDENGECG